MKLRAAHYSGIRGKLLEDAVLAPFTWFRVGGAADLLFLPQDVEDLQEFLRQTPASVPVTVLGAASNTIVRDGGVEGVVVRLAGKQWGKIEVVNAVSVEVGAGALDMAVARFTAKEGISGLEFLSGIPGTIGGALPTNAGCYGRELKDVLNQLTIMTRAGELVTYQGGLVDYGLPQIRFEYRHSDLPPNCIVVGALLSGDDVEPPEVILQRMKGLAANREDAQPIREKTGGSTFANPDPPGTPDQRKSWQLIDAAGMRGARKGGAQVSEKHCNFLINTGDATAADIEGLGEEVRAAVKATSGVDLRWEIKRIGRAT